jgi:two-component sensor histidine kinase
MWVTDHLPQLRLAGSSATTPIGPAVTTLRSVIARLAWVVRCTAVAYIAVQLIIWHSFYAAHPWRLAVPVAVMAWAVSVTVYLRQRSPATILVCVDSVVYAAVALGAQGTVPLSVRDHAFSWLAISMTSQLIVPTWYAPSALSAPLAIALPVTYWVGAEQTANTGVRSTTATAIVLLMVAGVHIYGRRQLYGRAAAADAALGSADRAAGEQFVMLSRNIERREHERLLHDTILNTLTALARSGSDDLAKVVSRCRQDVALIEGALSDPGDPGSGAEGRDGDLVSRIQAVAAQMRDRGLDVLVEITGDREPVVPAPVAAAISAAAREALSNVAAHAGTGQAWVQVSLAAPHGHGPGPDSLKVTVRDRGAGFDLGGVSPSRLGLRRSIAERAADCGGRASIWSAPGEGTVVCLTWPATPEAADGAGRPDLAGAESGHDAAAGWSLAHESLPW